MIFRSFITMLMFSPVLQAELRDNANSFYLHNVWPGLQEGGVLAKV